MEDLVHHGEAERYGGWSWHEPRYGEHFRRCSYCGCVHPDDLAAEVGLRADWADRKYGWPHKFYVDIPNRNASRLYVLSSSSNHHPEWLSTADADPDLEEVLERDGYGKGNRYRPKFVQLGARTNHFGKFYTTHLADQALSADTRIAIEQLCGLHFTFMPEGRVSWTSTG